MCVASQVVADVFDREEKDANEEVEPCE